jgi:hypothetical protein
MKNTSKIIKIIMIMNFLFSFELKTYLQFWKTNFYIF